MKALLIFILLFSCCFAAPGLGQASDQGSVAASHREKPRVGGARQAKADSLAQAEADAAAAQDQIPTVPEPVNSRVSQAQADYNEAYWKYQREVIDHTRKVYAWQHISSIIIFYVVIFLVLMGVLFSWLQFKAAAFKGESEELDASMKGVKITSSTLGVVILVLSMCFFYLYLRYVYPINMNEGAKIITSSEKEASH
ncbi:MAG: hypothetical protein WA869_36715 [Alloacidobacterium sp.]|jgi:hypothetical protein